MISGNLVNKVRCSVLVNVFVCFFSFEWHPNLSTHHSLVAVLLPFQVDLVTGPVEPLTVYLHQNLSRHLLSVSRGLQCSCDWVHSGGLNGPFWHFDLKGGTPCDLTCFLLFVSHFWSHLCVLYVRSCLHCGNWTVFGFFRIKKWPNHISCHAFKMHIHYKWILGPIRLKVETQQVFLMILIKILLQSAQLSPSAVMYET